jgi:hypothetical protein
MHGARGGAPEEKKNGNYRHGARTKETIELRKSPPFAAQMSSMWA